MDHCLVFSPEKNLLCKFSMKSFCFAFFYKVQGNIFGQKSLIYPIFPLKMYERHWEKKKMLLIANVNLCWKLHTSYLCIYRQSSFFFSPPVYNWSWILNFFLSSQTKRNSWIQKFNLQLWPNVNCILWLNFRCWTKFTSQMFNKSTLILYDMNYKKK